MSIAQTSPNTIELADQQFEQSQLGSYSGYHALVPVLIGLAIPLTLFVTIQPDALRDARFVATAILLLIGVSAAAIFVVSLLNPGTILAVRFDSAARVAQVIRSGTFANIVYSVPFNRVVAVRLETQYDDDGYAVQKALMVLQPREVIELPPSTSARDIALIKAAIGIR
jgi:hypothetical protein